MSKEELGAELVGYLNRIMKVPQLEKVEKEKKRTLSAFDKKMLKDLDIRKNQNPFILDTLMKSKVKTRIQRNKKFLLCIRKPRRKEPLDIF